MDPMGPGIPQNVWNLEESGHSKLKLHPEMSETGNRSYAEGGALKGMFSSVPFGERNQRGHVVKQFQRHESTWNYPFQTVNPGRWGVWLWIYETWTCIEHEHVLNMYINWIEFPKIFWLEDIFLYFQVEVKEFSTKSASTSPKKRQPSILRGKLSEIIIRTVTGTSQKQRIRSFVPLAKPPVTWVLGEKNMKRSSGQRFLPIFCGWVTL